MLTVTLGVDLGGTKISFALMDTSGKTLAREKINTPQSMDDIMDVLIQTSVRVINSSDVRTTGIGVAVAGQIDRKARSVVFSPNLPIKSEYPVGAKLMEAAGLPVFIENDANAAAIGERVFGQAKGMDNFISLTLGTGIGGGVFTEGNLLLGHIGAGGEVGHVKIDPDGPLCGCGAHGCLEAFASGSAIGRDATKIFGKPATAAEVAELALKGDDKAKALLASAGRRLGHGLVTFVNLFNPEAIFLCGSMAKAPQDYFGPAFAEVRENAFGTSGESLVIKVSSLGDDIGVIGAASLPVIYMATPD